MVLLKSATFKSVFSFKAPEVAVRHVDSDNHERDPQLLRRKGYGWWSSLILDTILSLLPICFIVFAVLSLSLNNKQRSSYGNKIMSTTLLWPTVFPIMYSAIFGKFLRRVGLYKAERGVTLRTLERLMGSQSLFTTVERQIGLRRLDLFGIILIALWVLSPLGGQATLRLLNTKPREIDVNGTIRYFPIEGYQTTYLNGGNTIVYATARYAPLYMTSLHLARTYMDKPMDLWDAVKIPDIGSASVEMGGDWRGFGNGENITYSSLLGVPVAGIPSTGNTTFDLVSHYWAVDCGAFEAGTMKEWNTTQEYMSWYSFKMNLLAEMPPGPQDPRTFNYISLTEVPNPGEEVKVVTTNCSARLTYVESRVNCVNRDCHVEAMRPYNRIGYPFQKSLFQTLIQALPGIDIGLQAQRQLPTSSEMTETWIMDPETTFDDTATGSDLYVNLATLPTPVFSKRLQMVMNTLWDAASTARYRTGNLSPNMNFTLRERGNGPLTFNSTNLSGVQFEGEKYAANKTFAILTIVISWILFMASIISLVLAAGLTIAPDILGYMSTYLRNNAYADVQGPSNLDGLETTRMLGDTHVIIGDVKSERDVGRVAIATTGMGVTRLEKKRLYD